MNSYQKTMMIQRTIRIFVTLCYCWISIAGQTLLPDQEAQARRKRIEEKIAYYQSDAFKAKLAARASKYNNPAYVDHVVNGKKHRQEAWQAYMREPLLAIDVPTAMPLTNPAITHKKKDGGYQIVLFSKADAAGMALQTGTLGIQWLVYRIIQIQATQLFATLLADEQEALCAILDDTSKDTAYQGGELVRHLHAKSSYHTLSISMAVQAALSNCLQQLRNSFFLDTPTIKERAYGIALQWFLYSNNFSEAVRLGINNLKAPREWIKEATLMEAALAGTEWCNEWLDQHALIPAALTSWWWRTGTQLGICTILTRWYLQQVMIPLTAAHLLAKKEAYKTALLLPPLQREAALQNIVQTSLYVPFGTWLSMCQKHETALQFCAQLVPFCFGLNNLYNQVHALPTPTTPTP